MITRYQVIRNNISFCTYECARVLECCCINTYTNSLYIYTYLVHDYMTYMYEYVHFLHESMVSFLCELGNARRGGWLMSAVSDTVT